MANPQLPSTTSETLFSDDTSRIVRKVGSIIDHAGNLLPDPRPEDANALAKASSEYHAALWPASLDQIENLLIQMRSMTQHRTESAEEATASFDMLAGSLQPYPIDILRKAIKLYTTDPEAKGARFFPKSPSELTRYADPMLRLRQARAMNFSRLAKLAHELAEEKSKLSAAPIETSDAELINFGLSHAKTELRMGWITQEQFDRCFPR